MILGSSLIVVGVLALLLVIVPAVGVGVFVDVLGILLAAGFTACVWGLAAMLWVFIRREWF